MMARSTSSHVRPDRLARTKMTIPFEFPCNARPVHRAVHDHGASATIAFFIPRCLAIFIAQALSQDHLLVRVSMTWAAS